MQKIISICAFLAALCVGAYMLMTASHERVEGVITNIQLVGDRQDLSINFIDGQGKQNTFVRRYSPRRAPDMASPVIGARVEIAYQTGNSDSADIYAYRRGNRFGMAVAIASCLVVAVAGLTGKLRRSHKVSN
jgi:hypothetical protein